MHTAFEVLIVVSATPQTQVERLMLDRGMSEAAVRARIAAQAPLETKSEVADFLLDNEGSIEALERQVDRVWADLQARETG
jgi:dephospho-CoA kinase